MREKIARYIAEVGDEYYLAETEPPEQVADQILSLISEEIEKVENDYSWSDQVIAFEDCRKKILSLLKE